MSTQLYTNAGALAVAAAMQAYLANAEIHLFKSGTITLTNETTLAELEAEEADFDGYAEETVAAWFDPILNATGGASIETPSVQFAIESPYTTPNVIQGWWLQDAGGNLIVCGDFDAPIALVGAGGGIPMLVQLVFG